MLLETPTELYYEERTVFRKRIPNNVTWTFKLEIKSGRNKPSCVNVEYRESG